jgi:transposase
MVDSGGAAGTARNRQPLARAKGHDESGQLGDLDGRIRDHHRFLIGQHLKTIEQVETTIGEFDARIEAALAPFRDAVERLKDVPGISRTAAQIVIAEIGIDMSQFPSADHLISWAGLRPRLDESAGKRRSTRVRKGATWLKPVLVQSALAVRTQKTRVLIRTIEQAPSSTPPRNAGTQETRSLIRTTPAREGVISSFEAGVLLAARRG